MFIDEQPQFSEFAISMLYYMPFLKFDSLKRTYFCMYL